MDQEQTPAQQAAWRGHQLGPVQEIGPYYLCRCQVRGCAGGFVWKMGQQSWLDLSAAQLPCPVDPFEPPSKADDLRPREPG